ncbi:MAG: hypothetical protein HYY93_10045, partial [Planctomycetes bacterium]|nr:hypothetical protein [Planctomycetota bacterium]
AGGGNAVAVTNGIYAFDLGSGPITAGSQTSVANCLANVAAVWLEMQVGAETLTPRTRLVSAAYALNSDTLDGRDSSFFATASGSAPIGAEYVTRINDGTLSSERALAAGLGLSLADGGANSSLTLGFTYTDTVGANPAVAANGTMFGSNGVLFEGATADASEGILTPAALGGDRTWTLPDSSGTVLLDTTSGSIPLAGTAGRILYDNGTNWTALAAGTSNQVLVCGGAGAPSWGNTISATANPQFGATSSTTTADGSALSGTASGAARVYGVFGSASSTTANASGVKGVASGTSGAPNGLWGVATASTGGAGVFGQGGGWGVLGSTSVGGSIGVQGENTSTTASTTRFGVYGNAVGAGAGATNIGVIGIADAAGTTNYGVDGETSTANGIGVRGLAAGAVATQFGVYGVISSSSTGTGQGVRGENVSTATSGSHYGVVGLTNGAGVGSTHIGVYGGASGGTTNLAGYFEDSEQFKIPDWGVSVPTRSLSGCMGTARPGGVGRIYFAANGFLYYVSNTAGGDYSEFFETADPTLAIGEVVAPDSEGARSVRRAEPRDAASFFGVVSQYGTRNNDDRQGLRSQDPRFINVGMLGQLPVLVTMEGGEIAPGDPLSLSPRWRGRVTKARGPGRVIGFALTHFPYREGETTTPDDVNGRPEDRLTADHVFCILQPGWHQPVESGDRGEMPPLQPSWHEVERRFEQRPPDISPPVENPAIPPRPVESSEPHQRADVGETRGRSRP